MEMELVIAKNNGFKLLRGKEIEHEGVSLKRFIEIITQEPDVIDSYRNQQIKIDDESLSLQESERIIAALEIAMANEIFSEVLLDDDY